MSLRAMGTSVAPSPVVFVSGHCFQMIWIHAQWDEAEMVNLKAFGDWTLD